MTGIRGAGHRWGADAVGGNRSLGVWKRGWDAGRGYGLGLFEALGDGQVQFENLGQQVFFGGETVGGEDGGVQGGVGVFQRVRAGQLEGAPEAGVDLRRGSASFAPAMPLRETDCRRCQYMRASNGSRDSQRASPVVRRDE